MRSAPTASQPGLCASCSSLMAAALPLGAKAPLAAAGPLPAVWNAGTKAYSMGSSYYKKMYRDKLRFVVFAKDDAGKAWVFLTSQRGDHPWTLDTPMAFESKYSPVRERVWEFGLDTSSKGVAAMHTVLRRSLDEFKRVSEQNKQRFYYKTVEMQWGDLVRFTQKHFEAQLCGLFHWRILPWRPMRKLKWSTS
eukprot:145981-Rhodomonas_salina.2